MHLTITDILNDPPTALDGLGILVGSLVNPSTTIGCRDIASASSEGYSQAKGPAQRISIISDFRNVPPTTPRQ